ncbi:MAG: hypothetical protein IJP74_12355 [Prevotella sp.]|nr:hypothetical protein [Prevotella sp.]
MRRVLLWCVAALLTVSCGENRHKEADALLGKAKAFYEQGRYEDALATIDSLRKVFPNAIDTRKQALTLYQNVELKKTQQELALVDSALQAVKQDYEYQRHKVEKDKQALRATPDELTMLTRKRVHRDSLQTRFDVLCAKIRYIHKKQKE